MNTLWDFIDIDVDKNASIQQRFEAFHKANPRVYQELYKLASLMKGKGHKRIGMQMLIEKLRWEWYETTTNTDGFKINNDYAAHYSRLLMKEKPELAGLFSVRPIQQDSTTETRSQRLSQVETADIGDF